MSVPGLQPAHACVFAAGICSRHPPRRGAATGQESHLVTLENNLNYAMQSERYEEARAIQREITLQLHPSQRAQREMERVQVRAVVNRTASPPFLPWFLDA